MCLLTSQMATTSTSRPLLRSTFGIANTQPHQHLYPLHRDLCSNSEHYRSVFSSTDVIGALCGLLDDCSRKAAPLAAQSIALLASRPDDRAFIRDAGGIENLVEVLRREHDVSEAMLDAVLRALAPFASDPTTREQLMATGVLTPLLKVLNTQHCEEVVVAATVLLQHCAFDHSHQDAIRCVQDANFVEEHDMCTGREVAWHCSSASLPTPLSSARCSRPPCMPWWS